MLSNYEKKHYTSGYGVRLNHTIGDSAEDSTLGYPHCTTEFLLLYFICGTGNIKIEGKEYSIREGDLVLINPSELFHCTIDGGKHHARYGVHIDESITRYFPGNCQELFNTLYKRQGGVGNHIPSEIAKENGLHTIVESIHQHIKEADSISSALTICKTIELLAKLLQYTAEYPEHIQPPARENQLIQDVLYYLNENFRENLSVEQVAKIFGIDRSYLSHLFKANVGTPLWNYVIFRRINHFNNLLAKNIPIEQACRQSGFQNYSNFYRLYKKYMDMTPLQYKQQLKS